MSSIYDKSSLVLIPSGTKTSKVYSQVPTNGDGDFDFTRSTAATRIAANGNIEKETQNLLLQSNSFDTSWATTNASVTGGQSGYDGSNDAWLLTATSTTNARVEQTNTNNGVQTFSVYAKKGTADFIRLGANVTGGGSFYYSYFDLANGTIETNTFLIDSNIEDVGGSWYRCSITYNSTNIKVVLNACDADGSSAVTNGAYILIQDAQLNQGLIAQEVITTTTTALYGGITDNVPRLDYTDSSCPALLLEPQRLNAVAHSEYLESLPAFNASLLSNEAISPEGVNNATKLSALIAAPSSQWARGTNIVQPNQKQALSIYAKAGNIDDFTITYYDQSTSDLFFNYDLAAGSVSAPTGSPYYVDADIQDMGNGWYRCIAIVNAQASGTNAQFQISAGVQRVVSNIGDYVYIYGYQWEQNQSYATSYIPTYGTSVTRNAEAAYKTGISSLIGGVEGTIFFDIKTNKTLTSTNYKQFFYYSDSSSAQSYMYISGNNYIVGNPNLGNIVSGQTIQADTRYKIAITYKANDFKLYINGSLSATRTSGSVIDAVDITSIGSYSGVSEFNEFKFNSYMHFQEVLTNEELATLTTI